MAEQHPVVLFDGECGFCLGSVRFIIRNDPAAVLRFLPKDSPAGLRMLNEAGLSPDVQSMVLLEPARASIRSDASVRIASFLQPPWNRLALLRFIPRPLRDLGYRAIAALRHHLSPRRSCSLAGLPGPDRFLPTQ